MSVDYKGRRQRLVALQCTVRSALKDRRTERSASPIDMSGLLESTGPASQHPYNLQELHRYSESLLVEIQQIYRRSEATLSQINQLKRKKENIERLIDCVTSILELKRLSKGLGASPEEVYQGIKTFYEVRDRTVYCERLISKIEQDIKEQKVRYKELFDREAKLSNSEKIGLYSKILNVIIDCADSPETGSSLEKLLGLYQETVRKDYLAIEEELFRVPLTAGTLTADYSYIFFELVKNSLKAFVSSYKVFRGNVQRLYGDEGVHQLALSLLQHNLSPMLSEIFKRMKKYFELDKVALTAKNPILREKDQLIVEHFSSQYRSISNQLERFVLYIKENSVTREYPQLASFEHELLQGINSETVLDMDNTLIKFFQAYLRHKVNNLIKRSPFITSIWQLDVEFFRNAEAQPNLYDLPSLHDYLDEMFVIFGKAVESACETLKLLIVSSIINYESNHLIYEDSFYAFNELFRKFVGRLTLTPTVFQTAIVLVLNCLYFFPSNFKHFETLKLPEEVPQKRIRMELEEMQHLNIRKARELLKEYLAEICELPYFATQLDTVNYKELLKGWDRLHRDVYDQLVEALAAVHARRIKESISKRKLDNLSVMSLEKEVRSYVAHYESVSHANVLERFRVVLLMCSALLLDSEDELNRFLRESSIEAEEVQEVRDVFLSKKNQR